MPTKKLFVPVKISTGRKGVAERRGTRAFALIDAPNIFKARELEKNFYKKYLRSRKGLAKKGFGNPEAMIEYAKQRDTGWRDLIAVRSEIAVDSSHYLKSSNSRIMSIRGLLIKAGVNVETPMAVRNLSAEELKKNRLPSNLGGGWELFERGNYTRFDYLASNIDYSLVKRQVLLIAKKMHSLGIAHNHLHLGNFAVNPAGNLKLLDLSIARLYKRPAKTKQEFFERFLQDYKLLSEGLAWVRNPDRTSVEFAEEEVDVLYELVNANSQAKKLGISSSNVFSEIAKIGR